MTAISVPARRPARSALSALAVWGSLALGLAAAVAIVGFNELGYRRSANSVNRVALYDSGRDALHSLLRLVLEAESDQRGYRLTGNDAYLFAYRSTNKAVAEQLTATRRLFLQTPQEAAEFVALSGLIERKRAALQETLPLRERSGDPPPKTALTGDVGNELTARTRAQIDAMIAERSREIEALREHTMRSLSMARGGIALTSVIALLAFYQTIRQGRALALANRQRREELERERDQLDGMVRERTARLVELATYLQNVREDERAHLARELHDELGSLLTAAKLDVARLKSRIGDDPPIRERLAHLTSTLNSGIALKRQIIEDLRPSALSNLGLTASLDILTREFAERSNIKVEAQIDELQVDASTQLTIYRLVQESLTNIAKHANAGKVTVRVEHRRDEVSVEIRDDGEGFDAQRTRPNSSGLAGMRHRVETSGGTLVIRSDPATGTSIAARLPTSKPV